MSKLQKATLRRAPRSARNAPKASPSVQKPRTLTEDEADILYCEKHKHEPRIPLRQVLEKLGIDETEVGL